MSRPLDLVSKDFNSYTEYIFRDGLLMECIFT
eukprot:UN06528